MGASPQVLDVAAPLAPSPTGEAEAMIARMDEVLLACEKSEMQSPDAVVQAEISALHVLRDAVEQQWPLPEAVVKAINVGPVAAKNIADWNPSLADSLMRVDHALRKQSQVAAAE